MLEDKKEEKHFEIIIRPGQTCKICTCGYSKTLPYCDDTHREINEQQGTNYKSVKLRNPSDNTMVFDSYSSNWNKE